MTPPVLRIVVLLGLLSGPVYADDVVGVNVVNPMRASVAALTESARQAVAPSGKDQAPDPTATLRIRVGVPLAARGPAPNIADSAFTAIRLPNGKFRGFTAAGTTWAIDGGHPYDMGGAGVAVLKAGPPNTANSEDCNHMGRKEALLGYDLKD